MRHALGFAFVVALAGCAKPAAPPPTPVVEDPSCPPGMFPDAGRCASIDPACPPGQKLVTGRGCVPESDVEPPPAASSATSDDGGPREVSPGVVIQDLVVGSGLVAAAGHKLTVHYDGRIPHGAVFDSSRTRGTPFKFPLGAGVVIKGWDEGLVGMRAGGKRRLTIAPEKAYGERGRPPLIPAFATLEFDVELLEVR